MKRASIEDPEPIHCTSATRPAHPPAGTRVLEEDTGWVFEYQGDGSWHSVWPDGWLSRHLDPEGALNADTIANEATNWKLGLPVGCGYIIYAGPDTRVWERGIAGAP